ENLGQRAATPPTTGTHKTKRLYPKQITEAYTENNTYEQSYQPFTPAAAPGQNLYQQPSQFFTPAGDQNLQATTPTSMYSQHAQPQQLEISQLRNQLGNMNIGGPTQLQLLPTQLIGVPPNVRELDAPPPPINLPPNTSVTPSDKANCDPSYKRCTINAIPGTSTLLNKSRLPFALIITPYRSLKDGDDAVPVVTDTVIARCRRCRTYINPFVTFVDGGQRWKCNMCFLINEVPAQFDWDLQTNQQTDRWK
ncbi:16299_t:CDS:2, partial [Acaulospora morrowiae]